MDKGEYTVTEHLSLSSVIPKDYSIRISKITFTIEQMSTFSCRNNSELFSNV